MRRAVFCAACIALAFVLTDRVIAGNGGMQGSAASVDRTLKADRAAFQGFPSPAAKTLPAPGRGVNSMAQPLPEGCETGISPLAKSVNAAPSALCIS